MFRRFLATSASASAASAAAKTATTKSKDVVIIGGGPAGLSLLAALKSSPVTRNLDCTLVEGFSLDRVREFGTNPPDEYTNRVVSLTPKSVEFMQAKIGNWDLFNHDRLKFYNQITAFDAQNPLNSRIEFDGDDVDAEFLAVMAENVNIQSSLLQRIEQLESLDSIIDNTKVVDISSSEFVPNQEQTQASQLDWPIVTLSNGEIIQTRLLVGADGYNSPVRKFAGIESRGWAYDRFGVVATVKMQCEDYRAIGWQKFLTTGPLAILPLTEENATIVWSCTPKLADLVTSVDPAIFPELVNAAMTLDEPELQFIYKKLETNPLDMSVIEDIAWRQSKIDELVLEERYPLPLVELVEGSRAKFPLKMLHADTYTAKRVALIGDAAHTIHPLAGQGLNMGQSDVQLLVEAIEVGVSRGMDIGSTLVLEPYTSNQWPSNHVLLGICDKLHKVFSTDFFPLALVRGLGLQGLNSFSPIKDMMIKSISGK